MYSNHRTLVLSLKKLSKGVSITAIVPGPNAAHHVLKFASNFLPINSAQTLRHRIKGESNVEAVHLDHIWDDLGPKAYRKFLDIKERYDNKESGLDLPSAVQEVCRAFHNNLYLVKHFRPFLHDGDDFRLAEDYDDTRCIVITSHGVTTMRAAFGSSLSRWDSAKITALLRRAVDEPEYRIAVTTLQGDVAHRAMELMQRFIDGAESFTTPKGGQPHDLAPLLVELSRHSKLIPSYLYLSTSAPEDRPQRTGEFSIVYRSRHKRESVAYKRLNRLQRERHPDVTEMTKKLERHAVQWRQLKHENLVPFLGLNSSHLYNETCIVTPWYEGSSIISYLNAKGSKVSSEALCSMLLETARAISYLHSNNIVHGAIRGGNVIIDDKGHARVTDYDQNLFRDLETVRYDIGGTSFWEAPELIRPTLFGTSGHLTFATDVYAYACLCIEGYTRKRPFHPSNNRAVSEKVVEGQRPDRPYGPGGTLMADGMWSLVESCWSQQASERPSMAGVISKLEEITRSAA
ncbi:hypothetical protein NLI96_g2931 [Meripilus lineatus]|uniref:Protein kinase domain-containing protein n=1 Tax=Meripilus lineatus TaxID=2056292 RepID=A0AAD5YH31_9APHY|nr:hypothetical protein NLI96_g2931 [Physisporinus lineatus]